MTLLFSSAPAAYTSDVLEPIRVSIASLAILVLLSPFHLLERKHPLLQRRAAMLGASSLFYACTLVSLTAQICQDEASAILNIVIPMLASISMAFFIRAMLLLDRQIGTKGFLLILTATLSVATVTFIGINLLFRPAWLLIICSAVCLTGGILAASRAKSLNSIEKPVSSVLCARITDSTRMHAPHRRVILCGILLLESFLISYELNGIQLTLHFPDRSVTGLPIIGSSSTVSLLAITILLVACIVVSLSELTARPTIAAAIAALLICSAFFFQASKTPVVFVLLFPLICLLLIVTSASFFAAFKGSKVAIGRQRTLFHAIFSIGALLGAIVALIVLANERTIQYYFFSWMPAIIVLVEIIALIALAGLQKTGNDDAGMPSGGLKKLDLFEGRPDVSSLEGRCSLIAHEHGLTKREAEVLDLLAMGRNVPSISKTLVISVSTVKTHVNQIYRKVGVGSRQELIDMLYGEGSPKKMA